MNTPPSNALRPCLRALAAAALCMAASLGHADGTNDDYLHANGGRLYDAAGQEVRLTGISWFGFETDLQVFHGLWSVNMQNVLNTVANRGFNVVRIPLSVQLVNQWRNGNGGTAGSINYSANPGLQGMSSLQVFDAAIAAAKQSGLKVMLDMHRVVNTQQYNGWTAQGYTTADFEASWQWLATRYKNDDTVIAVDLFNEPHGMPGDPTMIKWDGSSDANNWPYEAARVANQILSINPNLLIVVEGIAATPKTGFTYADPNSGNYDYNWWGGNLRRAATYPVNLGNAQKQLAYSAHDYGSSVANQPWFYNGFTEATLTADCWQPNWLYLVTQNLAPVIIGEWGGKLDGGSNQAWMTALASTIKTHRLNHFFWAVNPNSGDTGGILLDDWSTVDSAKYAIVAPTLWTDANGKFIGLDHQVNLGANGTHVASATNGSGTGTGGGTGTPVVNATISPTTVSVDKATATNLSVTLTPNGNALTDIFNGGSTLKVGTQYTVSGNTVTLLASYLKTLPKGALTLTFGFDKGSNPTLIVVVNDSSTTVIPVTGVTVSPAQLTLTGTTTGQLTAAPAPTNATGVTVSWQSSNPAVATVNASGLVSAVANGSATITATVTAANGSYSANSTVSVSGIGSNAGAPAGCANAIATSLPLTIDGAKDVCYVTSGTVNFVNSWNMQTVQINGTNYANVWSNTLPVRINGNLYFRYVGQFPWSHLEVSGSGGSTSSPTAPAQYTLTMAVNGNGSTNVAVGPHDYTSGTTVSVTATPASGTRFTGWSGSASGSTNPVTITMDGNKSLTANFTATTTTTDNNSLPSQCSGTCNATTPSTPILSNSGGRGNVTMYSTGTSNGGACNYGATSVRSYAAINVNRLPGDLQGQWQGGQVCGQCAEVTTLTSQGLKTATVRIMDKCPDDNCGIDVGGDAPAALMSDGFGRYAGTWKFVACDGHPEVSDGVPSLAVADGSNAWWARVRVVNPVNGVASIEWKNTTTAAQGSLPFSNNPENAYEVPISEVLQTSGNFLITVHYVDGRTATVQLSAAQLAAAGGHYALN